MPHDPRVSEPDAAPTRSRARSLRAWTHLARPIALVLLAALAAGGGGRVAAHQLTPRSLPQLPREVRLEPRLLPTTPGVPELPAHLSALGLTAAPPADAGSGTVIALVDLGVDGDLPALDGRLLPAIRLVDPGDDPDPREHGTALAGLLVGAPAERMPAEPMPAESIPVRGLVPGASILPIQVGTDLAPPDAATVAEGIRVGCARADVVLVGLAGFTASPELEEAVRSGVAAGCLIVAPAGNQGVHHLPAPAALDGVIAVAALDADGLLAAESNLDAEAIAVAAPAEATTLSPGDGRALIDGSSASAALVAGALAWAIGEHGGLDPVRARDLLRDSARPLADDAAEALGFGVLDLPALLAAARPGAPAAPALVGLRVAPLTPLPGQEIAVEVTVRNRGGSAGGPAEVAVAAGGASATAEIPLLAAGGSATVTLRLTAPGADGELTATLSGAGAAAGSLTVPLAVSREPVPRVVVTSTRLGSIPVAGGPAVELSATVENWGNAEARDLEVVFQLDDRVLDRRNLPALAVGERREVRASWSPAAGDADRVGSLLVAAAAEGSELTDLGVLVRDVLVAGPGAPLDPQYADKTGEAIELVADAPHYSVAGIDYLPVLAFFPQIDLAKYRGARQAGNPPRAATPCEVLNVTLRGVTYRIRRSSPQILGLSILDLNRLDRAFNATGPRDPRPAEVQGAVRSSAVFALSSLQRPVVVGDDDQPPLREQVDGVTVVDEQGRPVTGDADLARRLLCPRETGHVVFRVPKQRLLARTLLQIMPAGGVPAALTARRDVPHLQLGVELHLVPNPLAGTMRRTQAQARAEISRTFTMSQRQISYGPGLEPLAGHRRVRKQLLVQLGDALPLPPAGGGAGNLRDDRYVDAHFHTIAEYVGLELDVSKRPLAPFKAFGGPLQMLAESAVSIGLVPVSEVPVRGGRPDVRIDLLRHKVLATDHNVFYSESEEPRYYGERTPPVLADLLTPPPEVAGTAPGPGPRTELELFRRTFGLALGEELTLRPFAPGGSSPAGRPPRDDPHGLSFLDLSLEGPWYGGKASFRRAVNAADLVLDVDRAADNPNTLRNVLAQARCARMPPAGCRTCCGRLSGAEVVDDDELRELCAEQACARGFRTGREPFLYAAHPFAADFLWNREGFEITDLASGTGESPRRADGRDRSVVTVGDDFLYKGAQLWNRRAPLSVARVDLPLRRLQAPYPVNARLTAFLRAPDRQEPVLFAGPGEPGYADGWLLELLAGQQDWMARNSDGLRFAFTGRSDPMDVKLIRKIYAAAGTDAHGDFNYQEDILSSATDLGAVKRFVSDPVVQRLTRPAGFDFAHQQLQASNAFGIVRTLLLTADKPVPEGIAAGPGGRAEGATEADQRAIQALADGNTVLTDGPAIDFSLDADGRFDSASLSWHSGINLHQNRDGRIGGEGRFDGGRSMLVVNGYAVLDESGGGGVPDELVPFPGGFGGLDGPLGPFGGTVIGVTGTVRPLQVLTPLVTPGLVRQTPTVALENRPGSGYPDVFYSFAWNNPDAFGGQPIAVHLYRGTPGHVPSLDRPTRRFTLGEVPPAGIVHPEWKVARFPSQSTDTDATDRISDLSYTYAEALTGRATPQTADHRAITNPVWSIPVGVRILLDRPLVSAPEGLAATIPACGLRIEYNFPISMKAASYPVRIRQLDERGDSLDDPADAIAATFLPLTPACQEADNFGWSPRAQPRNAGQVRHSKYIVRNDRPIPVGGPFFPRPENFPRPGGGGLDDLETSLDARRLLRSFVVYFASGTAPFGPLDFHDNPLNTIAALFSVELVPLAIQPPPDGDPLPPEIDPLPPELQPLPPIGPRPPTGIGPRPLPGGTVERPGGGIVLPNGIRLAPRPPAAGSPR